jgi:poly(3-hydroxybutyrate) depolymerase
LGRLLLLHGRTPDAAGTAEISGMNDVADENGFLVEYLDVEEAQSC